MALGRSIMECNISAIFRLPLELRDEIYKYIVLEEEEVKLDHLPRRPHSDDQHIRCSWTVAQPRYDARILEFGVKKGLQVYMSIPAPLYQVNKQIQREMSDLLEYSDLPVVARVRNFDFEHVAQYLTQPASKPIHQQHVVREDGTIACRLMIELSGPYDDEWEKNLVRWIEVLEVLLPRGREELGAMHKTVQFNGPWGIRAPPEIISRVQEMHRGRPVGSGRLELEKVFFALYTRWRVEVMMNWHSFVGNTTSPVLSQALFGWSFG